MMNNGFMNGQDYLVKHNSDSIRHMYSYSDDTLRLKDYRKVIDKALSMGLTIEYLDMTELHDIGDTGFRIGEYPLDKIENFLNPGYSVETASIEFNYGNKHFLTRMNFLGPTSFIVYTDASDESGHIVYELIQALKEKPLERSVLQQFSISYIKSLGEIQTEKCAGWREARFDASADQWRLRIQLDDRGIWFLSVFVNSTGSLDKYSLDKELASDSHYIFSDEIGVRKKLYRPGDNCRCFDDILIRYVKQYGGEALLDELYPYITAQYHFD